MSAKSDYNSDSDSGESWSTDDGLDFYDSNPSLKEQVDAFEDALMTDRSGNMTKALLVGQTDDSELVRDMLDRALRLGHVGPIKGALMYAGQHKKIPGIGLRPDIITWLTRSETTCDELIRTTLRHAFEGVDRSSLEWFLDDSDIRTISGVLGYLPDVLVDAILRLADPHADGVYKLVCKWMRCIVKDKSFGWVGWVGWADKNVSIWTYYSRRGSLGSLRTLHENRTEGCTVNVMNYAAENGHLDVVEWLHANRTEGCTVRAMDRAARNGHLEVVEWLHAKRAACTKDAMNRAAEYGHLEVVKFLHANRTEGCTKDAMNWAALKGHLEVVKWLHTNRTEGCTKDAMNWAARDGHLEVVKWLHANRTEGCTKYAMNEAAHYGHLEVVEWLHANRTEGCSVHAMNLAASNGHLEVVKWLHANRTEGCTKDARDRAAENGHLEVVKWLIHESHN